MHGIAPTLRSGLLAAALVALAGGSPLSAQIDDVELLGLQYGTRPPQAYLDARDAGRLPGGGMTFQRGWAARNPSLRATRPGEGPLPRFEASTLAFEGGVPAAVLGQRDGPVEGTFRFPLILGYYADDAGPPAYDAATVQREFFDGPNSRYRTIPEYYDAMSGGRIDLVGETFPWVQADLTERQTAGTSSGLAQGSRVSSFIRSVLEQIDDGSVDWGRYDNDGPDGLPNSGDDDGFVDVLAVFHPQWGAECGGTGRNDRIWSHKFSLTLAATYDFEGGHVGPYVTDTPSASGGSIRIDDYTIQPVISCDRGNINEIGVLAHELGHGFGLPDLYSTGSRDHAGIGRWGLMGQGAWGCASNTPERPCGMTAWSRAVLGWVEVETLAPDTDHRDVVLEPVGTSGRVLRLDARDGSDDYFLLENRQRTGFDLDLLSPGLLVWHIDPDWTASLWPANRVNSDDRHLGVGLVQADGLRQLAIEGAGGNRGDGADPFPGDSGVTVFHAGRAPQAYSHDGAPAGVTLTEIALQGDAVTLRATSGFRTVTVGVTGTADASLVAVDDLPLAASGQTFLRAPFEALVLSAEPGEPLGPGRRRPFVQWIDQPTASKQRVLIVPVADDPSVAAAYGGEEVSLTVELEGGVLGVEPGAVVPTPASSDLWVPLGTAVSFRADATAGFAFDDWTGGWAGQPNPFTLTPNAPVVVGARFRLTFTSLARALAGGSAGLDARLTEALDEAGNGDGRYDVGDLRAHLRAGGGS